MMELILVLAILAILIAIIVPSYSVLTQRMRVNTDRSSAGNIANAVRAWHSDCSTDELLEHELEQIPLRTLVELSDVDGMERYVDVNTAPVSLLNEAKILDPAQKFFVGLLEREDGNVKIVVAIGTEVFALPENVVEDYDGTTRGVIYIDER